jgi:hypothetical protein
VGELTLADVVDAWQEPVGHGATDCAFVTDDVRRQSPDDSACGATCVLQESTDARVAADAGTRNVFAVIIPSIG